MKKIPIRSLPLILIFIFSFCIPWTVSAHSSEPRLELSAERLNPGATLEVRGVDFEVETPVLLKLVGSKIEKEFGKVTTDQEGESNLLP
jgi:hypothetical protein